MAIPKSIMSPMPDYILTHSMMITLLLSLGVFLPFLCIQKTNKTISRQYTVLFQKFHEKLILLRHPKVSFIKLSLLSNGGLPPKKRKSLERRGIIHQMRG